MTRNVLRKFGFTRTALVVGVGIPFMVAANAFAQAPDAAGQAEAERVIVTGSNIPTAEEVTASPLDTLNTAEIQRSGSSEVLNVLTKRNPDFTGGANIGSTNANVAAGTSLGGSTIQIRAFPTLVLYEGRRIADSAALANTGNAFAFTDVGLFPAALIARIEVLKDGASALYGSEAVGGVVNIFTKDDFQGAELGFRYGTVVEGAVQERRGYSIAGIGTETTQVTVGAQYLEIDPLFARQRDYSAVSTGGGTTNYAGAVRDQTNRYLPVGVTPANYPGAPIGNSPFDLGVTPGSVAPGEGFGAPQFNGYYRVVGAAEQASFNLDRVVTSTLDSSRTNVLASFTHQIFGKQLELFGNFLYSNSDFRNFLNGQPINNSTGLIILGSVRVNPAFNPDLPVGMGNEQLVPETRGAPAAFNPFQQTIDNFSGGGAFRLVAAQRFVNRPRIFDNENNFYRFLGGLRSQINEDWSVESAAYYSKYDITYANSNLPILQQINDAVAGVGDFAGTPLDPFAINPVGNGPGQLSPGQFNSLFGTNIRSESSFQRVFDGKLVGFPFSLPGGKIGVSFGAEYRLEGFKAVDSPEIFLGSTPISDIDKKRSIYSFYGEVSVPVVGPQMQIPWLYSLEVNLAGRFDHYEGVDEDAKVPKVSVRLQPIKDLTLRATYSNSFLAPNLFQTSGPNTQAFSPAIDFGEGAGNEQAQVLSGSNPNLLPSTAENVTAGLVYSPSFVPGLVISADYFRTLQRGLISFIGGATILFDVEANGANSQFANLVAFNGFPGTPGSRGVTGPGQLSGNLNQVFYIDTFQNLGASHAEGFDLSAHYTLDLHTMGQLELGVNAVVFDFYENKVFAIHSPYYNLQNLVGGEFVGAIPDYKLAFLAEYRWNGFTLSLTAQYIPELLSSVNRDPSSEDQSTFDPVDDYFTLDGRLSYTFKGRTTMGAAAAVDSKDAKSVVDAKSGAAAAAGAETMSPVQKLLDGLTLTVGCNNMLDEQPPLLIGGNSNTDLSVYDPYGQFVYFEVSKKF